MQVFKIFWQKASVAMMVVTLSYAVPGQVRIKDIVDFEGVRGNQLVGYGLVVGLNGTGDGVGAAGFTKESLVSMLERMGINTRDMNINPNNVAAVMVTANLVPFSRPGSRIDINVSAMGNAKSLMGGTLLVTPLVAADGEVYAVAQGAIAVGGFSAEGKSQSKIVKGVPTAGRIASGAIIERDTGFELANLSCLRMSLRNADFTTARRIEDAIVAKFGNESAKALDPKTVRLTLPRGFKGDMVQFLTAVEQLSITPDTSAKIVINEADGVIVMGKDVRVSEVAVTHGSISVRITETPIVSQPSPFTFVNGQSGISTSSESASGSTVAANEGPGKSTLTPPGGDAKAATTLETTSATKGSVTTPNATAKETFSDQTAAIRTAILDRSAVKVSEKKGKFAIMSAGTTIQELVDALNALGATPQDLISILQSIKASGALQAEIEVI